MVKFENIEIKYGDFVAIENLNLDIKEGEFFTFLGPSGCGKTTSLRALVGFLSPSKGKVYVGDKDVTNPPIRKIMNKTSRAKCNLFLLVLFCLRQ